MNDLYQFFDANSSTYTYVLIDETTRQAVMIDPVDHHLNQYLSFLADKQLSLKYVLETHAHADHITSAGALCRATGAQAATPAHCNISAAEIQLDEGHELAFGLNQVIKSIHTPGHTFGAMSYYWNGKLFTGDSLLINGCGRTDFQSGDAGMLFDSITQKLFGFPDETVVYPGHDYHGKTSSTIGDERANNSRVAGKSREEFIRIMSELHLPPPSMIDIAVPANKKLGLKHAAEV